MSSCCRVCQWTFLMGFRDPCQSVETSSVAPFDAVRTGETDQLNRGFAMLHFEGSFAPFVRPATAEWASSSSSSTTHSGQKPNLFLHIRRSFSKEREREREREKARSLFALLALPTACFAFFFLFFSSTPA